MRKKLSILIILLLLIIPIVSLGAEFKVGEELFIDDTLRENLYTAAGRANISANITGDVVVAGGEVTISGDVSQDVLAAGGNIQVLGIVRDDFRAAGGRIAIHENIGGDLVVAGGEVLVAPGVKIGGDISVAAGRLVFNGETDGKLLAGAGEVVIGGEISGDVNIKAGKVIVKEGAIVSGDFTYRAEEEAQISDEAKIIGQVNFTKGSLPKLPGFLAPLLLAISFFGKIVLLLVAGLLAVLLFNKFSRTIVEHSIVNFGGDFLRGLGTLIVTPIVLIVLLVTIVGIPVAFIGGLVWFLVISVAKILTGVVTGGLLSKWTKKKVIVDWKWAALGIVVIQVITLVPVIGWLAAIVVFITTLGSVSYLTYQKFWVKR